MSSKKVIIIGSGVAGLATAIRLALKGFSVDVFEQNSFAGGKLSFIKNGNYCFDAGPSLFTSPHLIEELFALANEPTHEYFTYKKTDTVCNYFFNDGVILNANSEVKEFANQLAALFNEDETIVLNYFENSKHLFNNTGNFFITNSLHLLSTYFNTKIFKALKASGQKHFTQSLHQFNQKHFRHKNTIQLFNRFATYNGSNPFKAPAMLSVISHLEHCTGVFYPQGGMISITNALLALAKKLHVNFNYNNKVERIIAHGGKVKGVVVAGKNYQADIIVSNGDFYYTYKNLLNNETLASKVLKQERSSSAIIFYWGINRTFNQLDLHNILFSDDYEKEFDCLFNKKKIYSSPTVYINITAKQEANLHAPKGCENWFVMINVPSSSKINWDESIAQCRQNIITTINKKLHTNIEDYIECEEVLHPQLIEQKTSSYLGSIYGTSSNSITAAFLRHANFNKHYKNLYFVGGSVHPGGGIPLCLNSAKIVASLVK